jgi:AraC-like DNA-binding protein
MVTLDTAGRSMGTLRLVAPPPDLRPLVEYVSIERRTDSRDPARQYRIVPDGSGHLIVHLDRDGRRAPCLHLVGARSVAIGVDKSSRSCTVALRLRPGALGALLRDDGRELLDRSLPAAEVLGAEGRRLQDRIADRPDPEAIVAALLAGVGRLARDGRRPDWRLAAADRLLRAVDGRADIDTVCERTGIAERTLREVVGRELGFSPKRLARILRIHGLIRIGMTAPQATGAEWAGAAGFADQAHMIRESRALLGETPRRFLARGPAGTGSRRFVQDPTAAGG